jgi:glycosyltransferase 2 family protein
VSAVAPTPGGLGAIEAALVSGLTLFGVAAGPAVTGVLLYRLLTFWAPNAPGAVAVRRLRRRALL